MVYGLLLASIATILIIISFPLVDEMTLAQVGLLIGELFLPVPIFLWARRTQMDLKQMFRVNPVSGSAVQAAIPIALGLTIVTDEMDRIAQVFVSTPEQFTKIQEMITITGPLSALFIIGIVVLIAPLIEELIFRGFFQRILEFRLNDVTKSVLFSALTFAIIHFNPWWIIQIYIIGVFMGYVAWRSNSIWISFIIHAINNGFAVWIAHQPESKIQWYEFHGHVSPIILILGLGLLIWGLRWFIRVTPLTNNTTDIVFIEDLYNNPPDSNSDN